MSKFGLLLLLTLIFSGAFAQKLDQEILMVESEITALDSSRLVLQAKLESLKQSKIIEDLSMMGFPTDDYISHTAMILSYNEKHEQANWVMHMILPDIRNGAVFRSNDFREDPLVSTGSATQIDYFLTDTLPDGDVKYDGFGYDRGHLAPSADYRWSASALSETYFYSNMSPQLPEFNRASWALLEDHLRRYVLSTNHPLYVLTAPVLNDDLPKIERSVNKVSIPQQYVKVVMDTESGEGIAFIMSNAKADYPLEHYAVSIDEAETLLGFDVFPSYEKNESTLKLNHWFEKLDTGDKEPLAQQNMPRSTFNTVVGGKRIGKVSEVCGHVVSSRISRSGHLWLNLDKQFPDQIFSIFIRKDDISNFSYEPQTFLVNKVYCFNGKVEDLNGTPTINIEREAQVEAFK